MANLPDLLTPPSGQHRPTVLALLLLICAAFGPIAICADEAPPLRLYVDVDLTHTSAVGDAIVLGVRTALAMSDRAEAIEVVPVDHRGNARRSLRTLVGAVADPQAIAVVGGMHSPAYLTFNKEINALRIPVLLPWSAGAAITRQAATPDNWFFRVSVDDAKAAPFLVGQTARAGCRLVDLIVVDGPWGRANAQAAAAALAAWNRPEPQVYTIPVSGGSHLAAEITARIKSAGTDCVIMVATVEASADLLAAIYTNGPPLTVFSHWGIFGQPARNLLPGGEVDAVDLRVLGTCGLHRRYRLEARLAAIDAAASGLAGRPVQIDLLDAPHAFLHAYDLTKLFLKALARAEAQPGWVESGSDPWARRDRVRAAFYRIERLDGLLKTYRRPFTAVSEDNPDGHEALGATDLCLTRFDRNGRVRPLRR